MKISFERQMKAPIAKVYSHWSDPNLIPKWWTPNVRFVQMDFKVGGKYRILWSHSDEITNQPYGVFTKITPLKEIEMTWRYDAIAPDFSSDIKMAFSEIRGMTLFTFTHDNFSVPEEIEPHREAWTEVMNLFSSYMSHPAI